MKEFIIFVCTDSTEFFSKQRSACLNYNLPSFVTDSYCAGGGGVSNKHCLLPFFIFLEPLLLVPFLVLNSWESWVFTP